MDLGLITYQVNVASEAFMDEVPTQVEFLEEIKDYQNEEAPQVLEEES